MKFKLVIITLLISLTAWAQTKPKPVLKPKAVLSNATKPRIAIKQKIGILLRPYDNSVTIRWSPADFETWEKGKRIGYNVYRRAVDGNKPVGSETKLNGSPIKPVIMETLERMIDTSETAKTALFNVYQDTTTDRSVADAMSKKESRNFNFVMGLIMANVHPLVAQLSGMVFTDNTVQKGVSYYYEVQLANLSKDPLAVAWATTTTGMEYKMPKPFEFGGRSSKNLTILNWRSDFVNFKYAYFDVYRSLVPDKDFVKVNKLPHIGFTSGNERTPFSTYQDTLPTLDKNYYYKVVGMSTFGEPGPMSEVVVVKAKKSLKFTPSLEKVFSADNKAVTLQWSHDQGDKSRLKGFVIQRALDPLESFTTISRTLFKTDTKFTDIKPLPAAFYRVVAVGIADDSAYSFNYMVQLVDSVPPASPIKLTYTVDTNNIVKIRWVKNKEPDMLGYRVFKTYGDKTEYTRLTVGHIPDTTFTDTIARSLGCKKVFYTLVAIDTRYNPSNYTAALEVILPDNTPPSAPQLHFYELKPHKVILKWENSLSLDVVEQHLLRKAEFEYDWKKIVLIKGDSLRTTKAFTDTTAKPGTQYQYTLQAIDDRGLKSAYSNIFRLKAIGDQFKPAVKDIKAYSSAPNNMIKLAWQYNELSIKHFVVYRQAENEKIHLLETLPGTAREFYDKDLKPATKYTYYLVAHFNDWKQSKMSEGIMVSY